MVGQQPMGIEDEIPIPNRELKGARLAKDQQGSSCAV
jgi:hypothetical protein